MSTAPISPSEWKTRRSLIDPKLNALGWNVAKTDATSTTIPPGTATLTEYPTDSGPADYVLCNGGRIVGIVEAKRVAVSPAGVLTQAERYARGLPPGDFDYKCRENVLTWLVGRVTEPRSIEKLRPVLSASKGDATGKLAAQKAGEFHVATEKEVTPVRVTPSLVKTEQLPEERIAALARASAPGSA